MKYKIVHFKVENKEFQQAVDFSRAFYNLELDNSSSYRGGSPLVSYLDQAITSGDLPGVVMAWYNGIYWYKSMVEDMAIGQPTIEPALSGLRSYMYTMVKDENDHIVAEYGRTALKSFDKIQVRNVSDFLLAATNLHVRSSSGIHSSL